MTLEQIEKRALAQAIKLHGSIVGAARQLGIGRATAFRKAKKYGLDSPYDRTSPAFMPGLKAVAGPKHPPKPVVQTAPDKVEPLWESNGDPLFGNWKP